MWYTTCYLGRCPRRLHLAASRPLSRPGGNSRQNPDKTPAAKPGKIPKAKSRGADGGISGLFLTSTRRLFRLFGLFAIRNLRAEAFLPWLARLHGDCQRAISDAHDLHRVSESVSISRFVLTMRTTGHQAQQPACDCSLPPRPLPVPESTARRPPVCRSQIPC